MSYYNILTGYQGFDFSGFFSHLEGSGLERAFAVDALDDKQFLSLLSAQAAIYLEEMAQKAHKITLGHFGRTIQLYTPLYLSNHCDNHCLYCGFNIKNNIQRKKLSLEELENEARFIAATGMRHILILTGESRKFSPVSYIKECIKILKKYFSSISIEIYPLNEEEYASLVKEGVDGLTIYQETYDEDVYKAMHVAGPKKEYLFRLDAPERAAKSFLHSINLGVLLGLSDWRKDIFFLGLHARYLQEKFPSIEIGVSVPRLRPQVGDFKAPFIVSDKDFAQIILALRLFLPWAGITVSTRESGQLREHLLPLGLTRLSAASATWVGGHTQEESKSSAQFYTSDTRSVSQIKEMLEAKGYQPVFKDWERF